MSKHVAANKKGKAKQVQKERLHVSAKELGVRRKTRVREGERGGGGGQGQEPKRKIEVSQRKLREIAMERYEELNQ